MESRRSIAASGLSRRLPEPGWLWVMACGVAGFAEATLFFIVPDVTLTAAAAAPARHLRWCYAACVCFAVVGAVLMLVWARMDPEGARALLQRIPAITPEMAVRAGDDLAHHGAWGVVRAGFLGMPLKLYAVEAGARGWSGWGFAAACLIGRALRLGVTTLVARLLAGAPWIREGRRRWVVWAGIWVVVYAVYWLR